MMNSRNIHRPVLPAPPGPDNVPRSAFRDPTSEERVLGRQLVAGRQAAQQLQTAQESRATIPLAVRARLQVQIQTGEQARSRLILACVSLVERLARQYSGYGLPREDLVQEGWLGVLRATTTFDPVKGASFRTHARWAARKAILDALTARSRLIRLPTGVVAALRQVTAAQQQWLQTHDRAPTVADLACLTGLPAARVAQILGLAEPPLSLNAPGGGDAASAPAVPHAAVLNPDPAALGLAAVQRQEIAAALGRLNPRARQILGWRFGLADGVPYTLEEVATRLQLSAAAVQQIEAAALRTLRLMLAAASAREAAR